MLHIRNILGQNKSLNAFAVELTLLWIKQPQMYVQFDALACCHFRFLEDTNDPRHAPRQYHRFLHSLHSSLL